MYATSIGDLLLFLLLTLHGFPIHPPLSHSHSRPAFKWESLK